MLVFRWRAHRGQRRRFTAAIQSVGVLWGGWCANLGRGATRGFRCGLRFRASRFRGPRRAIARCAHWIRWCKRVAQDLRALRERGDLADEGVQLLLSGGGLLRIGTAEVSHLFLVLVALGSLFFDEGGDALISAHA